MTDIALPAEAATVREQAMTLANARTWGILIKDHGTREQIASEMVQIKAVQKQWASIIDPVVESAHRTHKNAIEARAIVLTPLVAGYMMRRSAIAAWDDRVEREQRAEAARRQKEAEEATARERVEREAELERQMNAQLEAAEMAAQKAALLEEQGRKEEANALLETASSLEEEARHSEAAIAESEAESVAPIILPPVEAPKSEFTSSRKTWDFRVLDKSKMVIAFLEPNEVAIRKVVVAMGESAGAVIGVGAVEVFQKRILATKGSAA